MENLLDYHICNNEDVWLDGFRVTFPKVMYPKRKLLAVPTTLIKSIAKLLLVKDSCNMGANNTITTASSSSSGAPRRPTSFLTRNTCFQLKKAQLGPTHLASVNKSTM